MIIRLAAAFAGLAVLLPAMIWGGSLAVEIIIPVVGVLCLEEYARMALPDRRWMATVWLTVATGAVYAVTLYVGGGSIALVSALVVLLSMVWGTLFPGADLDRAADRVGRLALGMAWMGFLTFFPLLRRLEHGLSWIFLVLTVAWLADTGGYFAGRFFGKHKMYERISPKKTWEGFAGGIVLGTVGTVIVWAFGMPTPLWTCFVIGPLLAASSVIGDLAESLLKRSFGVKDSGAIMPGHGGLLDRIDSVLFVAPLVYGYATLVVGDP